MHPFSALQAYRQWVLVKLVPLPNGKTDKIPVDPGMRAVNAHDPANWLSYDHVFRYRDWLAPAAGAGYSLTFGFVLAESDPFWCLDIDGALQADRTWSPTALRVCQQLAGAAVEVSQSGTGLHLWGSGTVPGHTCKNTSMGLELYTSRRFIAVGHWKTAVGDCSRDCGAAIAAVAAEYFSASERQNDNGWTDSPREAGCGIEDDLYLVAMASRSQGMRSIFGDAASFSDLWRADVDALAQAYPDPTGVRAYDASSADMALAQHLAFWTACNCEQMQRLMQQSALSRNKWTREDYLPRTILTATARQKDIYRPRARAQESSPMTGTSPVAGTSKTRVQELLMCKFLRPSEYEELFRDCVYLRDLDGVLVHNGDVLNRERFNSWFAGPGYIIDEGTGKVAKTPWEAFMAGSIRFPRAEYAAFRPALATGEIYESEGRTYANTYVPIQTPRCAGDAVPFLRHVEKLLPCERDRTILLSYMAAVVQYPGIKFSWTPFIQGTKGNGKSFLSTCLAEAVGRRYWYSPRASELTGRFNDWIYRKLLITIEDVYLPKQKVEIMEILKPMITGEYLEVEGKGVAAGTREICANFILNSNFKDGIKIEADERRYAPFFTGQQHRDDLVRDGMTGTYFKELFAWARAGGYAIVNDYLCGYDIPEEFNPATYGAERAPRTSSSDEAERLAAGPIEQEVREAIASGRIGFRGDYISSHHLAVLLRETGRGHLTHIQRQTMLDGLGYRKHLGLPDGRTPHPPPCDGTRSILYVRKDSDAERIRIAAAVVADYAERQGMFSGASPPAASPVSTLNRVTH